MRYLNKKAFFCMGTARVCDDRREFGMSIRSMESVASCCKADSAC